MNPVQLPYPSISTRRWGNSERFSILACLWIIMRTFCLRTQMRLIRKLLKNFPICIEKYIFKIYQQLLAPEYSSKRSCNVLGHPLPPNLECLHLSMFLKSFKFVLLRRSTNNFCVVTCSMWNKQSTTKVNKSFIFSLLNFFLLAFFFDCLAIINYYSQIIKIVLSCVQIRSYWP